MALIQILAAGSKPIVRQPRRVLCVQLCYAGLIRCALWFLLILPSALQAEQTLARMCFWVPSDRMSEFETAFQDKVVPLLKTQGLMVSSTPSRPTMDNVFARLFEVKTPADIPKTRNALDKNPGWDAILKDLGTAFGQTDPGGPISSESQNRGTIFGKGDFGGRIPATFALYSTSAPGKTQSAGPGKVRAANPPQGFWHRFDTVDGPAGAKVFGIIQDRKGNLWFSARGSGVSRYDGQKWTTFATKDGLASNQVTSMMSDKKGNIWFSTIDEGVSCYDGQKWTTITTKDGLASNQTWTIIEDREENIWIGTEEGLSCYDPSASSGQLAWTTFTQKEGMAGNRIRGTCQDREGNIWVGVLGKGVNRYDGEKWTLFTIEDGLAGHQIWTIFQDREGNIWVGTWDGGVSRYNGKKWITFNTQNGLSGNRVASIFEDKEGKLWVGTENGASQYDGKKWTSLNTKAHLPARSILSVFQDREGYFWFGTSTYGISRYDRHEFVTFTKEEGMANRTTGLLEDRNGHLWVGSIGGGASRFDGKNWTTFTTEDGLVDNDVVRIFQDREGNFWLGSANFGNRLNGGGVSRYDGHTFTTFKGQLGLPHTRVIEIFQDRQGIIWFGTGGGGVSRFDGKHWTTFTRADGLGGHTIQDIFQDKDGILWFTTKGGGVSRYDASAESIPGKAKAPRIESQTFTTLTVKDGLPNDFVTSVMQDREGYLWFTTWGGVSRYDPSASPGQAQFTVVKPEMWSTDLLVQKILQDRTGHIWMASLGRGVARYDGRVFQTLTSQEGLGNSINDFIQDSAGNLWFAISGLGITRYRPSPPTPPPVFIDAVVADRRYQKTDNLDIPSSSELISFEFHGVSMKTSPGNLVYRYRLNGYEKDWQTTRNQRVEYHDLPRDTYTFEVQAVDRDLTYSEQPATATIHVHLPYERIGWGMTLAIAVLLIGWQTVRVVRRD